MPEYAPRPDEPSGRLHVPPSYDIPRRDTAYRHQTFPARLAADKVLQDIDDLLDPDLADKRKAGESPPPENPPGRETAEEAPLSTTIRALGSHALNLVLPAEDAESDHLAEAA